MLRTSSERGRFSRSGRVRGGGDGGGERGPPTILTSFATASCWRRCWLQRARTATRRTSTGGSRPLTHDDRLDRRGGPRAPWGGAAGDGHRRRAARASIGSAERRRPARPGTGPDPPRPDRAAQEAARRAVALLPGDEAAQETLADAQWLPQRRGRGPRRLSRPRCRDRAGRREMRSCARPERSSSSGPVGSADSWRRCLGYSSSRCETAG